LFKSLEVLLFILNALTIIFDLVDDASYRTLILPKFTTNPDKPFDKRIKPSNNLLRNLSLERPKETPILEKPNQIQSLERNQKKPVP